MVLDVPLRDFVDFAVTAGPPKLTKVKALKSKPPYKPEQDFWKKLRDQIVRHHRQHLPGKLDLDQLLIGLTDPKKVARYPACVAGYLGRKDIGWFEPPTVHWPVQPDVTIRIRPELGLYIDGVPYVVKLNFRATALSRRQRDLYLLLMSKALSGHVPEGTQYALLEVPKAKVYATAGANPALLPLVMGEALSFQVMWNSLS